MSPATPVWQTTIFTGEVFGGYCAYCNMELSASAVTGNLYRPHARHVPSVSLSVRLLNPEEYRGLELTLRAEFFVGRDRPILDLPLQIPSIVLGLHCAYCLAEKLPIIPDDVLTFRFQHKDHIQALRLHAVLQNFAAQPLQQNLSVAGHYDPSLRTPGPAALPASFALDRAAQLVHLSRSLQGIITGVRCNACRSKYPVKNISETVNELTLHQCHWDSVHFQVRLHAPEDYAGRELEIHAFPFSLSSLVSSDGVTIDCVLLKLFRQHGGPSIAPLIASQVAAYIQASEGRRNQPRFLALVRGQDGRVLRRDFPVIHVHAPSRSFPAVSRFEEATLHPAMEEA